MAASKDETLRPRKAGLPGSREPLEHLKLSVECCPTVFLRSLSSLLSVFCLLSPQSRDRPPPQLAQGS